MLWVLVFLFETIPKKGLPISEVAPIFLLAAAQNRFESLKEQGNSKLSQYRSTYNSESGHDFRKRTLLQINNTDDGGIDRSYQEKDLGFTSAPNLTQHGRQEGNGSPMLGRYLAHPFRLPVLLRTLGLYSLFTDILYPLSLLCLIMEHAIQSLKDIVFEGNASVQIYLSLLWTSWRHKKSATCFLPSASWLTVKI